MESFIKLLGFVFLVIVVPTCITHFACLSARKAGRAPCWRHALAGSLIPSFLVGLFVLASGSHAHIPEIVPLAIVALCFLLTLLPAYFVMARQRKSFASEQSGKGPILPPLSEVEDPQ